MAKDPSPRADMLRAQREARYGHLTAKGDQFVGLADTDRAPKPTGKKIPYAGKESGKAIAPKGSVKAPHNQRKDEGK
jgi:hypothetical protein